MPPAQKLTHGKLKNFSDLSCLSFRVYVDILSAIFVVNDVHGFKLNNPAEEVDYLFH